VWSDLVEAPETAKKNCAYNKSGAGVPLVLKAVLFGSGRLVVILISGKTLFLEV
jgi:hypothetical protein